MTAQQEIDLFFRERRDHRRQLLLWRCALSERTATEQTQLYRHKQEKSNKSEAIHGLPRAETFSFDLRRYFLSVTPVPFTWKMYPFKTHAQNHRSVIVTSTSLVPPLCAKAWRYASTKRSFCLMGINWNNMIPVLDPSPVPRRCSSGPRGADGIMSGVE